jgi:hypothetical protein
MKIDQIFDRLIHLLVCRRPEHRQYVLSPYMNMFDRKPSDALDGNKNQGNSSREPEEARTILRNLAGELQSGDALLLGVDMVKDEPTLVAAYNDKDGDHGKIQPKHAASPQSRAWR